MRSETQGFGYRCRLLWLYGEYIEPAVGIAVDHPLVEDDMVGERLDSERVRAGVKCHGERDKGLATQNVIGPLLALLTISDDNYSWCVVIDAYAALQTATIEGMGGNKR